MINKRNSVGCLSLIVLALAVIGFDLLQLQAGLETPTEAVLEAALAETLATSPFVPITSYDRFSVPVEEGISVDVHLRETPVPSTTANLPP